ncbi:hypothetical protein MIND_00915900 [Mycena indigotica]|uniref:Transmembrane protein n=1 Tax=Mycena indigotica TaxID=2126181 RepID=A0A8H6SDQ1_9AGAR|nr:uncharacterized protein MIND_00915900 [Mycena indigotica]KAF7296846.1 hypothetical protein MIND_00915900 [Mycena indigotica]
MYTSVFTIFTLGASALATVIDTRGLQSEAKCDASFEWADNAAGNTPCLLTAYVWGACTTNNWDVPVLTPGNQYTNPNATTATPCSCSWAAYNLISACTACQLNDAGIQTWASYSQLCQAFESDVYFPSNIPLRADTLIPFWAGTNPTGWTDGKFNVQQAQLVSNQHKPDLDPFKPPPGHKSKPIGAIVGGVVGGCVVVALAVVLTLLYRHKRGQSSGATQVAGSRSSYFSRPTIHGRSMSDLSGKSIISSPHGQTMSILTRSGHGTGYRPGTIYTTNTQAHTGSVHSLSYFSTSGPSSPPSHTQQLQFAASPEERIEPYPLGMPHSAPGPSHKGSQSTLRTAYNSQEAGPSGSGSATVTPGTPPAGMTSFMDSVPEGEEADHARARQAQEAELARLNSASPPAYTPYASPSASPEPQPIDPAVAAARFGHKRRAMPGAASIDSTRSFDSMSTSSYGHDGSISAIDEVVGRMGLAVPPTPGGASTVVTGESAAMGMGERRHKPSVSNP